MLCENVNVARVLVLALDVRAGVDGRDRRRDAALRPLPLLPLVCDGPVLVQCEHGEHVLAVGHVRVGLRRGAVLLEHAVEPAPEGRVDTSAVKVNVWSLASVISSGPVRMIPIGGCETVHVYSAGVGSNRPATSLARTRSVCVPRVRSENCWASSTSCSPRRRASTRSVTSPTRLSVPANVKVAIVSESTSGGLERICVVGGTVSGPSSMTHSYSAGGSSTTSSGFVARTSNSCVPLSSGPQTACGEVQGRKSAPSSAHS